MSTETMEVRMAMLVGSNGKAACMPDDKHTDWGMLADDLMDWDGTKSSDPKATARYLVTVRVPVPSITEIAASKVEELK